MTAIPSNKKAPNDYLYERIPRGKAAELDLTPSDSLLMEQVRIFRNELSSCQFKPSELKVHLDSMFGQEKV